MALATIGSQPSSGGEPLWGATGASDNHIFRSLRRLHVGAHCVHTRAVEFLSTIYSFYNIDVKIIFYCRENFDDLYHLILPPIDNLYLVEHY